jgi:hypothetical protein
VRENDDCDCKSFFHFSFLLFFLFINVLTSIFSLKSPQGKIAFYILSRFYVTDSKIPHNKVLEYIKNRVFLEDKSRRRSNLSMKQANELRQKTMIKGGSSKTGTAGQQQQPPAQANPYGTTDKDVSAQQAALWTAADLPVYFTGGFAPKNLPDLMELINDLYKVAKQNPALLDDSIVPFHPSTIALTVSTNKKNNFRLGGSKGSSNARRNFGRATGAAVPGSASTAYSEDSSHDIKSSPSNTILHNPRGGVGGTTTTLKGRVGGKRNDTLHSSTNSSSSSTTSVDNNGIITHVPTPPVSQRPTEITKNPSRANRMLSIIRNDPNTNSGSSSNSNAASRGSNNTNSRTKLISEMILEADEEHEDDESDSPQSPQPTNRKTAGSVFAAKIATTTTAAPTITEVVDSKRKSFLNKSAESTVPVSSTTSSSTTDKLTALLPKSEFFPKNSSSPSELITRDPAATVTTPSPANASDLSPSSKPRSNSINRRPSVAEELLKKFERILLEINTIEKQNKDPDNLGFPSVVSPEPAPILAPATTTSTTTARRTSSMNMKKQVEDNENNPYAADVEEDHKKKNILRTSNKRLSDTGLLSSTDMTTTPKSPDEDPFLHRKNPLFSESISSQLSVSSNFSSTLNYSESEGEDMATPFKQMNRTTSKELSSSMTFGKSLERSSFLLKESVKNNRKRKDQASEDYLSSSGEESTLSGFGIR